MEIVGLVREVRDEGGQWEVRLEAEAPEARTLHCRATEELADDARLFGTEKVRAVLLEYDGFRLLWVRLASESAALPPEEVEDYLMKRWNGLQGNEMSPNALEDFVLRIGSAISR